MEYGVLVFPEKQRSLFLVYFFYTFPGLQVFWWYFGYLVFNKKKFKQVRLQRPIEQEGK